MEIIQLIKDGFNWLVSIFTINSRLKRLENHYRKRDPFFCESCHNDFYCHVGFEEKGQGFYKERYECRGCKHIATTSWKERNLRHH